MLEKVIIIYVLLSFWEWVLHSQVMHGNPSVLKKVPILGDYLARTATSHVNHHKEVMMDMRLRHVKEVNSLFFSWMITAITTILMFISLWGVFKFGPKEAGLISAGLGVLVSFLWNNWHTDMHDSGVKVDASVGFPNNPGMISKGPLYKWLWGYHAIHHMQKGDKYNYNIIFPGFDFLVGTNKGRCIDNTDYCSKGFDARCMTRQKRCYTNADSLPGDDVSVVPAIPF